MGTYAVSTVLATRPIGGIGAGATRFSARGVYGCVGVSPCDWTCRLIRGPIGAASTAAATDRPTAAQSSVCGERTARTETAYAPFASAAVAAPGADALA